MIAKTLLFVLLLGFSVSLSAQSRCFLNARIVDAQTQEPLAGALLRFDGVDLHAVTDSNGYIRVPMTCAEHTVRFQMLGYKPFARRMRIDGDTPVTLEMENIATQIEEIVVSSQSTVRNLETPALGVNLLSMKAVQKLPPAAGEVDILRGLQTLPGISAVGEGANGVNIRGGSVDQNLILLDNMPVFNPTHLLGLFSLFPTDAIREMQIYKGSVPARYGGRTAGILDVKLSEPDMEQFKMRGGIGLISNRFHIETPIVKDKLAWMSSTRFSFNEYLIKLYNHTFVTAPSEKRIPDNKPVFYDLANKLSWRIGTHDNLSLANYISYDSYQVDSLFSIANIVPSLATMQYGHFNLGLRWNHYFSDRFNLNVLAARSQYATTTTATDVNAGFVSATKIADLNAKMELSFAPEPKQRINAGITVNRYDLKPERLTPAAGSAVASVNLASEQFWEGAVFASDEYEINSRLLVDAGLRWVAYWNMGPGEVPVYQAGLPLSAHTIVDTLFIGKGKAESRYGRLEPRLALRYKIDENKSVKLGYNRMNQFLQMISNNTTPLPNVRWKSSDRYVPPQQSDLVSAGYFSDAKNRMWEWSLETYYRWQRHIYDYAFGTELNISPVVETQLLKGAARAYGAELMISKKKGVMTGWLSYTYARSFEKITGDYPELQSLNGGDWFRSNIDKPHTINILLNFQTEPHNSAAFTFVYSTGRPYTAPVSFYKNGFIIVPVYLNRNNARISDYHRLDFSWTISNPSMHEHRWQSSWVVTIYNVYGRKNAFSYFFNPRLASFQPFKVSVFPTPLFSLTYNFKFE